MFIPSKVETGLVGFDEISGGGLPKSSSMALIGKAGGGKIGFIRHLTWHLLKKGMKILYITVDQSADELKYDLSSYEENITKFEENGCLMIVDVFSKAADKMMEGLEVKELSLTIDKVNEISDMSFHQAAYDLKTIYNAGLKFFPPIPLKPYHRVCIFDSISPLFTTNTKGIFQFIHTLKFASRLTKATGIGIMHTGMHEEKTEETFKSLADGIIEIDRISPGSSSYISLHKYPGDYQTGPFPMEVDHEDITILPLAMPELASFE